jgi:hypothetical protein
MTTFAEEKHIVLDEKEDEKEDEKDLEGVGTITALIRNLSENHWLIASQVAYRHPPRPQFAGRSGSWEYVLIPGENENDDIRVTLREGVTVSSTRHAQHIQVSR